VHVIYDPEAADWSMPSSPPPMSTRSP